MCLFPMQGGGGGEKVYAEARGRAMKDKVDGKGDR